MKQKRYTEAKITFALRQAEPGRILSHDPVHLTGRGSMPWQ
jgi:hypothetical protein